MANRQTRSLPTCQNKSPTITTTGFYGFVSRWIAANTLLYICIACASSHIMIKKISGECPLLDNIRPEVSGLLLPGTQHVELDCDLPPARV